MADPVSQTITQTNIPDWLRPQVEGLLGGATQQIFGTTPTTDSNGQMKYDLTSIKPFQPYSTNPQDYYAGFSPLQNQAFQSAANLQTPGQFQFGSDLAGGAGLSALNAGNMYSMQATNPWATQAYMSPYMQNVVDAQQQQAQRQSDIARQGIGAQFAQSGAFGGGRYGVQQAQAAADLARQKQNIQATGLQNAFANAQQAQQFGANLGLQGASAAMGAAGQLGQLGAQQLGAQQGIIGLQQQQGAIQQQQQQNYINQAIQNYTNAQQYPLQQLNAYNALLRGYAVPGQTATQYQAAPSLANQLVGLGTAAYGASKLMGGSGNKAGGVIKMASGGIASINRKVLLDPDSVSLQQVKQGVQNGTIGDLIGIPVLSLIHI